MTYEKNFVLKILIHGKMFTISWMWFMKIEGKLIILIFINWNSWFPEHLISFSNSWLVQIHPVSNVTFNSPIPDGGKGSRPTNHGQAGLGSALQPSLQDPLGRAVQSLEVNLGTTMMTITTGDNGVERNTKLVSLRKWQYTWERSLHG